jgi:phage shock protein A
MDLFENTNQIVRVQAQEIIDSRGGSQNRQQSIESLENLDRQILKIENKLLERKGQLAKIERLAREKTHSDRQILNLQIQQLWTQLQLARHRGDEDSEQETLVELNLCETNAKATQAQISYYHEQIKSLQVQISLLETKLIETKNQRNYLNNQYLLNREEKIIDAEFVDRELVNIERNIERNRSLLQAIVNNRQELESRSFQAQEDAKNCYAGLVDALTKDNRSLALQNLIQEQFHQEIAKLLKHQSERQIEIIEFLQNNLTILEETKIIIENNFNQQKTRAEVEFAANEPIVDAELIINS